MATCKLHERIRTQLSDAENRYNSEAETLKFGLHIFKPDSAKLETVVALDIGVENSNTETRSGIRSFYSPSLYGYASAATLEKDIRGYLQRKSGLKLFGT